MKEFKIYEYQAKIIEDCLRSCSNFLNSRNKETCLDRNIMQSYEIIKNILEGNSDKQVFR